MSEGGPPMVLVLIDRDSRLRLLRQDGVQVAFLDMRVDPKVVLLPEVSHHFEMFDALQRVGGGEHPIISLASDDEAHTASVVISRIENGQIVVARGPE